MAQELDRAHQSSVPWSVSPGGSSNERERPGAHLFTSPLAVGVGGKGVVEGPHDLVHALHVSNAGVELGVDEHGAFKREVALEENGILCKRGERDENGVYVPYKEYEDNPYGYGDPKGYLYNELYTELYETGLDPVTKEPITHAWGDFTIDVNGDGKPDSGYFWGVDDGYGYYTGKEYKSGSKTIPEVHPYVANYMYHGPASISNMAVRCLAHAYMLTGDIKYGRLGAVVLDRLADTLPDMSTGQYPFLVTDGGEGIGKIQGALNDCTVLRIFAQGCDALYPLIDDPQVIEYLSAKSEKYGLENPKLSGSDIWSNWADGILRETYKSCLNTKLRGGFGHKHEALATAAVVLDSMPETEEMLDWLFKPGFEDKVNLICNGGNTNVELMATLDRDGFGNHGSPNYNKTWIEFLMSKMQLTIMTDMTNTICSIILNSRRCSLYSLRLHSFQNTPRR